MKDYYVLTESTGYKLSKEVEIWMDRGWVPQGSVSVSPDTFLSKGGYSQAMVKK